MTRLNKQDIYNIISGIIIFCQYFYVYSDCKYVPKISCTTSNSNDITVTCLYAI